VAGQNPSEVKKVIFCSGKVYYELVKEREARNLNDKIAIVRIEQLTPFPFDLVREQLDYYPKNCIVTWCQEEHKNAGAWSYIVARIHLTIRKMGLNKRMEYSGRFASASSATGNKHMHLMELSQMYNSAMDLNPQNPN